MESSIYAGYIDGLQSMLTTINNGPAAMVVEEEPLRLAMAGVGEQSPPAAAHSPPP